MGMNFNNFNTGYQDYNNNNYYNNQNTNSNSQGGSNGFLQGVPEDTRQAIINLMLLFLVLFFFLQFN